MTETTTTRTSGTSTSSTGIGASVLRPDGTPKVTGDFAYSSDLWLDDMLWGATLRSPHPRARIKSIDLGPALAVAGVYAVLTHEDVPGRKKYGLEIIDQPVLAIDQVRYTGEPVAIVAADRLDTARFAASKIVVDYEVLDPVVDPDAAMTPDQQDAYNKQLSSCDDAAEAQVDNEYDVDAANQVFNQIDQTVQNDPGYKQALAAWHQCAAKVGYNEPDRTTLIDEFRTKMGSIHDTLSAEATQEGSPGDATVA